MPDNVQIPLAGMSTKSDDAHRVRAFEATTVPAFRSVEASKTSLVKRSFLTRDMSIVEHDCDAVYS